jgi:DNA polymerase/3'-5' exonuclease PolX
MTANELADAVEGAGDNSFNDQAAYMLRQQAQEIETLKKELALQKLSDIGQEIEDRESAIYATGYWNGIAKKASEHA